MRASVYTRGLGTPTVSLHNIDSVVHCGISVVKRRALLTLGRHTGNKGFTSGAESLAIQDGGVRPVNNQTGASSRDFKAEDPQIKVRCDLSLTQRLRLACVVRLWYLIVSASTKVTIGLDAGNRVGGRSSPVPSCGVC